MATIRSMNKMMGGIVVSSLNSMVQAAPREGGCRVGCHSIDRTTIIKLSLKIIHSYVQSTFCHIKILVTMTESERYASNPTDAHLPGRLPAQSDQP